MEHKSQFASKLVVPSTKELQPAEQKTVLKANVAAIESVRQLHKT